MKSDQDLVLFTRNLVPQENWAHLAPDRPLFQCTGRAVHLYGPDGEHEVYEPCGRLLPDLCFRAEGGMHACRRRPVRPRCVACEQKISTAKNRLWHWERRETRAVGGHMRRERRQGLHQVHKIAEFYKLGGLEPGEIARAMKYAATHDTKCSHCGKHWSQMPGGPELQITLDRTDPRRLLAHDNWTLKCRTGNPQKGTTEPRAQQVRDAYWRELRERGEDLVRYLVQGHGYSLCQCDGGHWAVILATARRPPHTSRWRGSFRVPGRRLSAFRTERGRASLHRTAVVTGAKGYPNASTAARTSTMPGPPRRTRPPTRRRHAVDGPGRG